MTHTTHTGRSPVEVASDLITLVEAGSRVALDMQANASLRVSHKGTDLGQALTAADLAIGDLFRRALGSRLIEEETADAISKNEVRTLLSEPDWTFVADPIDGTKPFAGGLASWGIMIGACRSGWPEVGVIALPVWEGNRAAPGNLSPGDRVGLLLAAWDGQAFIAPTRNGCRTCELTPLRPPAVQRFHVGWLPVAAQRYTLDYSKGLFPWCESAFVADAARLALGELDATTFNHKLWDLTAPLPILMALGFRLYHWPDLQPPPDESVADLFDGDHTCHDDLWLICRDVKTATTLGGAIKRAS